MHVHGDSLDRLTLGLGHRCVAGFQGFAASTIRDAQRRAAVEIANHRHEFAALERLLIDPQDRRERGRPSPQAAIDRSLHDAVRLRPTQAKLATVASGQLPASSRSPAVPTAP